MEVDLPHIVKRLVNGACLIVVSVLFLSGCEEKAGDQPAETVEPWKPADYVDGAAIDPWDPDDKVQPLPVDEIPIGNDDEDQ